MPVALQFSVTDVCLPFLDKKADNFHIATRGSTVKSAVPWPREQDPLSTITCVKCGIVTDILKETWIDI